VVGWQQLPAYQQFDVWSKDVAWQQVPGPLGGVMIKVRSGLCFGAPPSARDGDTPYRSGLRSGPGPAPGDGAGRSQEATGPGLAAGQGAWEQMGEVKYKPRHARELWTRTRFGAIGSRAGWGGAHGLVLPDSGKMMQVVMSGCVSTDVDDRIPRARSALSGKAAKGARPPLPKGPI
jgi:hypothetical protein